MAGGSLADECCSEELAAWVEHACIPTATWPILDQELSQVQRVKRAVVRWHEAELRDGQSAVLIVIRESNSQFVRGARSRLRPALVIDCAHLSHRDEPTTHHAIDVG